MAITTNTYNMVTIPTDGVLFFKSLAGENITDGEEILAASTGYTHYLTKLFIITDTAMDVTIGSGETTGAITTIHFGPISLKAETGLIYWQAPPGMGVKCTASTSIVIDSTAQGTIWIEAHGKTCKNNI